MRFSEYKLKLYDMSSIKLILDLLLIAFGGQCLKKYLSNSFVAKSIQYTNLTFFYLAILQLDFTCTNFPGANNLF